MTLHIGIAGPILTADVAHLLHEGPRATHPHGYAGAPLLGLLVGGLLARGHRVSCYTLSNDLPLRPDATVALHGDRFTLHCCPMRPKAWPFNGRRVGRIVDLYAFERRGLQRAIAHSQPDVVHAHWAYEFAWAALGSGLPHVVTCHDVPWLIARFQRDFRHGGYRWARAGMAWHVLRRARRVTTVSPYMVGQIQPACRARVSVVPNPVGARPARTSTRADENRKPMRVLMAANGWDTRKNSTVALQAFALLAQRMSGAQLTVYGQGHDAGGPAAAWWRQHGLQGDVDFLGPVPHRQLLAAMDAADVFLHTSLEESFGAVIAEAMAAGIPVVAGANSGAVPWVLDGAGRCVDVEKPEAVAHALHALLNDRSERLRLGRIGIERVRDAFLPERVVSAYEDEYRLAGGDAR